MLDHVLFDLSEDWHNHRYGVDFSEDFWVDPIKRTEAYREMEYERGKRFPGTEIGSLEPKPHPVASGQYGHRFIPALFGCNIKYLPDQAPSADPLRWDFDEMAQLDMPDLRNNDVMKKALDDAKRMKAKYGFVESWINTGSPLNAAISIFGEDFIASCACEPETAQHVLMVMAKTMIRLLYEFQDYLNPPARVEHEGYGIGNCPAIMFSPEMYREVILPTDLWLRQQFKHFNIHHCGILDRYAELYTALTPDSLDVGGGSDYKLLREYFPNAQCTYIVNPEYFEGQSRAKIDQTIRTIVTDGGPAGKIDYLHTYGAGRNATDENIMDLYTSIQRQGLNQNDKN